MSKFSQHVGTPLMIILLLSVSCNIYEVHASEIKNWVRGPVEIMDDYFEAIVNFCFSQEREAVLLTEGEFAYENYAHHPPCPNNYDLEAQISFDSPPTKIVAGRSVNLSAYGFMNGYQTCCSLGFWFEYYGSCFSIEPVEQVVLDLHSLHDDPVPISVPDIPSATGWQGAVGDSIDVKLTMPVSGTECTVKGRGHRGLWLQWVYKLETELVSDVVINSFTGPDKPVCSDTKEREYTVSLTNTGSTTDTGNAYLSTDLKGVKIIDRDIPYNLAGGSSNAYVFKVIFPEDMYTADGKLNASISSDNGINNSVSGLSVNVSCRYTNEAAIFLWFYYTLRYHSGFSEEN